AKDCECADSRGCREPGRKDHGAGTDCKTEDGCGQGSTRAEAITDVSPGNLKQPISPEKGAEHASHGNRAEGEFFFDVLSRNAQVEAIQRGDRHDSHDDGQNPPTNSSRATGAN